MSVLTATPTWVIRARRRIWPNFHVLAVVSVPIAVVVWGALNATFHWFLSGVVLMAALPVPLAVGALCASSVLIDGQLERARLRKVALPAVVRMSTVYLVAIGAVLMAITAVHVHQLAPSPWTLSSVFSAIGGAAVAMVFSILITPLQARFPLTGWRNLIGLAIAGFRSAPVPALATVVTLVLAVRLAMWLPILWFITPGLLLLLMTTAAWTTVAALQITPFQEEGQST